MLRRINVFGILNDHFKTFRVGEKVIWFDIILYFVLPILTGFLIGTISPTLEKSVTDCILIALPVYISLFALVLFSVFRLSQNSRYNEENKERQLLKETCSNISYLIIISLISGCFLIASKMIVFPDILAVIFCIWYGLVINSFFTGLMILKRIHTMISIEFSN